MSIEIKGLDCIFNIGKDGKSPLYLSEIVKESPIKAIDFDTDSYDAGFDVILENGKVIQVRVSTMPSADTAFYIKIEK